MNWWVMNVKKLNPGTLGYKNLKAMTLLKALASKSGGKIKAVLLLVLRCKS